MKRFGAMAGLIAVSALAIGAANATTVTFTEGGSDGGSAGVISSLKPTTIDFDSGIPSQFTGTIINPTGNIGIAAPPFNDTTPYASVGSTAPPAETAILTLNTPETYFGLYWGSVDSYNTITFLDNHGNIITSYTGSAILNPANGFQGAGGSAYVNFFFSGGGVSQVEFTSSQAAFEFDNIASGVPEPSTWAMMILGFLGMGFLGYRKSSRSSGASFRLA